MNYEIKANANPTTSNQMIGTALNVAEDMSMILIGLSPVKPPRDSYVGEVVDACIKLVADCAGPDLMDYKDALYLSVKKRIDILVESNYWH
jgi:hypothetical protein